MRLVAGALVITAMAVPCAPAHADTLGALQISVCTTLDSYPNISGVVGVVRGLRELGYGPYQAAEIIGSAVTDVCPEHRPLVLRYARAGTPETIA